MSGEIQVADDTTMVEIVLKDELQGTPLSGLEHEYVMMGRSFNIDPLLVVAIAFKESRYGTTYTKEFNASHHNAFGLMTKTGLMECDTWAQCLTVQFNTIKRIIDREAKTISMVGAVYAEDPNWSVGVLAKYQQLWDKLQQMKSSL